MNRRLIYVIGPSGAGKDSVLGHLRQTWGGTPPAHWARRTITRAAQSGGEAHESVSADGFERLLRANAFAMHWRANGLSYGLRRTELAPLGSGHCVFVNGSRDYLAQAMQDWPGLSVVHISASPEVLAQRLAQRQREDSATIAQRLSRAVDLRLPPDAVHIVNEGRLEDAAMQLHQALIARLGAPR